MSNIDVFKINVMGQAVNMIIFLSKSFCENGHMVDTSIVISNVRKGSV